MDDSDAWPVDYDRHQHTVYVRGRSLSLPAVDAWMTALDEAFGSVVDGTVVDIGAGTGRFSVPIAERLGAWVVGVEPSAGMRSQALEHGRHRRVAYVGGRAEALPLRDRSVDGALLANVIHHVGDRGACALELARVLRPGAVVCVTGSIAERRPAEFLRWFPGAAAIAEAQAPTRDQLESDFHHGGLETVRFSHVDVEVAGSLRALADRLKLRAISTLELLPDEEFDAGMAALEAAAAAEVGPEPIIEPIPLLVLRRR